MEMVLFAGLLSGLAIAVVMLFYKNEIFGDMHFLLIVPFLLAVSGSLFIWSVCAIRNRLSRSLWIPPSP